MAWYRIAENVLDAIADAINAKTGGTSPMTPVEMVLEIQSIQTGGGSLPSIITKIGGGSFTPASDTNCQTYNIPHDLGVLPKAFVVWTEDITVGEAQTALFLVRSHYFDTPYDAASVASHLTMRINTNGAHAAGGYGITSAALSSWVTASNICVNFNTTYKSGCTYKWLAWA